MATVERKYYDINEESARLSHEMMSWSDYQEGSTTKEYLNDVDWVYDLADEVVIKRPSEKERVEKLSHRYAKRMADYYNRNSAIGTMCPSVMISGAGNFPVKKKEKQNKMWESNHKFYEETQKIIDKIKSIKNGNEIIKSDDERAIEKLEYKLQDLKELHQLTKDANKALRIKDIEEGNEELRSLGLSEKTIKTLREGNVLNQKGYPSWALSNNLQEIHRVEKRIQDLKAIKEQGTQKDEDHNGFTVVENTEVMRLQIIFDGKPDVEARSIMKKRGFRWAPSQKAWQRQITANGKWALKYAVEELDALLG